MASAEQQQERVRNLQKRFPDVPEEHIVAALREADWHAGKASKHLDRHAEAKGVRGDQPMEEAALPGVPLDASPPLAGPHGRRKLPLPPKPRGLPHEQRAALQVELPGSKDDAVAKATQVCPVSWQEAAKDLAAEQGILQATAAETNQAAESVAAAAEEHQAAEPLAATVGATQAAEALMSAAETIQATEPVVAAAEGPQAAEPWAAAAQAPQVTEPLRNAAEANQAPEHVGTAAEVPQAAEPLMTAAEANQVAASAQANQAIAPVAVAAEAPLEAEPLTTAAVVEQDLREGRGTTEGGGKGGSQGGGKGAATIVKGGGKGGKDKGPPLPAGKGKGKGKGTKPPDHVLAPEGSRTLRLRSDRKITDTVGTLWHNLQPWDVSGAGVLDGIHVDIERLRADMVVRARAPQRAEARDAASRPRSSACLHWVGMTMAAVGLTPELVEAAFLHDLSVLNAEQVRVLGEEVAPKASDPEVQEHLRSLEDDQVDPVTWGKSEKVILVIQNIPHSLDVIKILGHLSSLREEMFSPPQEINLQKRLQKTEARLKELHASQALRTILQTILLVRNVLAQQESYAFRLDSLDDLGRERVGQGTGSVLSHVVKDLLEAHNKGHRLRFYRQQAVCRLLESKKLRHLVWEFLDSPETSPLDALPLLKSCDPMLCDADVPGMFGQQVARMKELSTLCTKLLLESELNEQLEGQLRGMQKSADDACQVFTQGLERMEAAALALARLGGWEPSTEVLESQRWRLAKDTLTHLKLLGSQIEGELERTGRSRRLRCSCPPADLLSVTGTPADLNSWRRASVP